MISETDKSLAAVGPVLLLQELTPRLQVYAPMYNTLIEPPYAFDPSAPPTLDVDEKQLEAVTLVMDTATPMTLVPPEKLLEKLLAPAP